MRARFQLWLLSTCGVAAVLAAPRAASATQCAQLPVLFIVQDTSGSMAQSPDPGSIAQSKWQIAASAVPEVVNAYSNRFQFGMYMFPSDNLCAPGLVVNGVPSTPAQIQSSFDSAGPGGGTPTAVAIDQVRQYLASLQLTVPAYILVVTDGEPNCDTALDGATCQCTSNSYIGCDPNALYCDSSGQNCSYGNEINCLDATQTESAAANARAAGYPVYVVGFGSQTDVYNNKQVLDGIAQFGGTSQSFTATDQPSLEAALNAIAGSITTCCIDECSAGQSRCDASGGIDSCELDSSSGCYTWVPTQQCGNGEICSNGACTTCTTDCSPGQVQCSGNEVQSCQPQADGCNGWVTSETCSPGEICVASAGSGACCQDSCSPGATRCGADGTLETCVASAGGCASWQSSACAAGSLCIDGHCDLPCNTQSEIASCPNGFECEQNAAGSYCEPGSGAASTGGSSGSSGSGASGPSTAQADGGGAPRSEGPKRGVRPQGGCSSAGGDLLLALFPLLALSRRRSQTR